MSGVGLSGARIWTFLGSLCGGDPVIESCLFFPCLVAVIEAYLTLTSLCIYFLKRLRIMWHWPLVHVCTWPSIFTVLYTALYIKYTIWGWTNGSAVDTICCFPAEPRFYSQARHWQPPGSLSPGKPKASSRPYRYLHVCVYPNMDVHIYTYAHNKYVCVLIKYNI